MGKYFFFLHGVFWAFLELGNETADQKLLNQVNEYQNIYHSIFYQTNRSISIGVLSTIIIISVETSASVVFQFQK